MGIRTMPIKYKRCRFIRNETSFSSTGTTNNHALDALDAGSYHIVTLAVHENQKFKSIKTRKKSY